MRGKVLAVTGTNGKSTVVHFIHTLIPNTNIGGNWGVPASTIAFNQGDFVLEVSSFQLHYIRRFRPNIAMLTNVAPDHLDWHGSFKDYLEDKLRIFSNQMNGDVAILNMDDPYYPKVKKRIRVEIVRISLKNPKAEFYSNGRWAYTPFGRIEIPQHLKKNIYLYDLLLSLAGAIQLDTPDNVFTRVPLLTLLPHRLQKVGEINGVTFYDDSKGTNPLATRMALLSFEGKVILIMGGDDKGLDLSTLRDVLAQKVAAIVAVGKNRSTIHRLFSDLVAVLEAQNFKEAVEIAYSEALKYSVPVLLSPACASFDMFRNYKHRSKVFKEEVNRLESEIQNLR